MLVRLIHAYKVVSRLGNEKRQKIFILSLLAFCLLGNSTAIIETSNVLLVKDFSSNVSNSFIKYSTFTKLSIRNKSADLFSESTIKILPEVSSIITSSNSVSVPTACPMDISIDGSSPTCAGDSDGEITMTISNGTPPYMVTWPDGFVGTRRDDLLGGTYVVTVTDLQPCNVEFTFTIPEPTPVEIDTDATNVTCNGTDNGTIESRFSGGTTYANGTGYTFLYSDVLPEAHYSFEQSTNDYIGSNHLVGTNPGATENYGMVGPEKIYRFDFDGNTVLQYDNATGFMRDGFTQKTIFLSFIPATTTNNMILFEQGDDLNGLSIKIRSGQLVFRISGQNDWDEISFDGIAPGNLYSLQFVYDAGSMAVYQDASLLGNYTLGITEVEESADGGGFGGVVGTTNASGAGNNYVGGLDNVMFFDRALTQNELEAFNGSGIRDDLSTGTYDITVSDINGCTASTSVTIEKDSIDISIANVTDLTCTGFGNGAIEIDVSGGDGNYTYNWEGPSSYTNTSQDIFGLSGGVYNLTIEDGSGCLATESIGVIEPDSVKVTLINKVDQQCFGESDGSVDIEVTGGDGNYVYNWTTGAATQDLTDIPPGTYSLNVADGNNCGTFFIVQILPADQLRAEVNILTNPLCFGSSSGSIDVNIIGGQMPYSYDWNTGAYNTEDINNLSAGDYEFLVTDANSCTADLTVSLVEPAILTIALDSINSPACPSSTQGQIFIEVEGGTLPYSYNWNNDPALAYEDIAGLASGTYNLTVTDLNNCTESATYTVLDPPAIEIVIDTIIQPLCIGDSTGAIHVSVSGGTGNLTYTWSHGVTGVEDLSGLPQGFYMLTVSDENNCQETVSVNIVDPAAIQINLDYHSAAIYGGFNNAGVSCNGASDGEIRISANGGNGIFSYAWAHDASNNSGTIIGLSGGDYFVTAIDGNGCAATAQYFVYEPDSVGVSITYISSQDKFGYGVSCFGDTDGQIFVAASGGNGEHFYNWSHDNTLTASGDQDLAPGFYTVTVSDSNGCTSEMTNEITEPSIIEVSSTKTDISCEGASDGFIDVTVLGGVGAYFFTWDPAQPNFEDLGGLTAGTYTVTVSDGNNCTAVTSQTIGTPTTLVAAFDSKSDISCFGDNDGAFEINVSGGNLPYNYTWSDPVAVGEDPTGLPAGTYEVTISDNSGCSAVLSDVLLQPDTFSVTIDLIDQPDCFGTDSGGIQITANGGNGGYIYEWDNGIGFVEDPSGLAAGTYTVTVIDSENCIAQASGTIVAKSEIDLTIDNIVHVDCFGNKTGRIEITATGGTGVLTYDWDNGAGSIEDPVDLFANSYTVRVEDENGCYKDSTIIVSEPTLFEVVLDDFTDLSCFESGDGSIDITVSGGVAPYVYNWDNGIGNQEDLVALDSGLYSLTVTDFNLCEVNLQVPITQPQRLRIILNSVNDISCFGVNDGSIFSNGIGGTPPYSFAWTGSAEITPDLENLAPGTYTVTIYDQNGCTDSFSTQISEPTSLEISAVGHDVLCQGDSTGYIDNVVVTGGVPDYVFDYNDLDFEGIYTFEGSADDVSGNDNDLIRTNTGGLISYSNDAGTQNQSFNFDGNTKLKYDNDVGYLESAFLERTITMWIKPSRLTGIQVLYEEGDENRGLALKLDGNSLFARVEIASQPAVNSNTVTMTLDGLWHFVVVRFDNGEFELFVDGVSSGMVNAPFVSVTAHPESSGIGGTFTSDVFDSTDDNFYQGLMDEVRISTKSLTNDELDNLQNSSGDRNDLPVGLYTLAVIDANGCRTSTVISIEEPEVISVIKNSSDPSCFGLADGTVEVIPAGGVAPYSYAWSNGSNSNVQTSLATGTYEVTILDANACIFVTSLILIEPEELGVSAIVNNAVCFESSDGDIILTPKGGVAPYTYLWSDGSTSKDLTNVSAGTYEVTITDDNNCQLIYSDSIDEPEELELVSAVTDVLCEGELNGTIFIDVSVGVSPYVFSWSHGPSTKNVSDLGAGNYTVTVTDGNSCKKEFSFFVDEPEVIVVDATIVNVNCNGGGDGSIIDLEVLGGVGPYSYVWSDMAIEAHWPFEEGISDFDDISGNGHHAVQIFGDPTFDSDAIERTTSVNFDGDDKIEYAIEGVFMSQAIAHRSVSMWVKPTAFIGRQTLFEEGSIDRGFALRLNNNVIEARVKKGLNSETITENYPATSDWVHLTVVYDFGDFYLYINGIEVGMVATNFGIITLGILNNRGGIGGTIVQDVFVDNLINYDNFYNGLIDNVTYHTIALSQDQVSDMFVNNGDRTNMSAQSYDIKVYDSNGCVSEAPLTITEPEALELNFVQTNVSCFGGNTGAVGVTTTGGVAPYRFAWEHGAFTEDISNLTAGIYNLTVVDDNDCQDSLSVTITESGELEAEINFNQTYSGGYYVSCNASTDGSITATQTGGTAPYSYAWNYAGSTTQSLTNIGAGTYQVTITDANNCMDISTVIILDPPLLELGLETLLQYGGEEISCAGEEDARIESTVIGGVGPYIYTWQGQTTTDTFLENVGIGTYVLSVRDDNGCEISENITISEPNPISVDLTIEINYNGFEVSCNGATDGEISSAVSGGTGVYSYSWSNSATTSDITNVGAGTQILTVEDENGCIARDTVVLNAPPSIQFNASASDLNDCGTNDGSINVGATGGVGTYEYRVNGSPWQVEDEFLNLAPGTYDVYVRNTFGTCIEGPKTVVIDVPEAPLINNIIIVNPSLATASDGSVIVNASGSGNTTQLQYQLRGIRTWQTSNVFTNLLEGIYMVDVRFLGQTCFSSSSLELIAGAGIVGSGQESSFCSDEINGAQLVESYFIPGPEGQILQSLQSIDCGGATSSPDDPVHTYVSIGIVEDGVRIYYDQWENGYETNLAFPSQLFGENKTQIWGDDDPLNGIPPGYTRDILVAGGSIILDNEVVSTTTQSVTDFDGGDRIASQGNIAVTRVGWASGSETLFAGALEVYPTDLWGTEYKMPIGQNTPDDNSMFDYSGAMIMAENDNTTINIFIDGDNTAEVTRTLQRGESYLVDGGLLVGSRIIASDRVQVDLITGKPCATFESRWFTLKPIDQWSNEYYNPVSTENSAPTRVFLYNPDDVKTIMVRYLTNQNIVNTIAVGPGQTVDQLIPNGSGSKFYSSNPNDMFYAIAAIDAVSANVDNGIGATSGSDWGFALIPKDQLTSQITLVSFAPSHDPSLFCSDGSEVDKSSWTVVSVDSEETNDFDGVKENAIDGDENTFWLTDYTPGVGCAIGNADNVINSNGVSGANNVLGVADGLAAELYDNNDAITVDITDVIDQSANYSITWRRDPGTSNTPSINLYESTDGVSFTLHPSSPFQFNNTAYFNQIIAANIDTRYLRIVSQNIYNVDIDAIVQIV